MLSDQEKIILEKTAELYNLLVSLPAKHPSFVEETVVDIHRIQHRVMARVAARLHPEFFVQR